MTGIEIRPGQIFRAAIAGTKDAFVEMKVHIVPGDGRVIISPSNQRYRPLIITEDILRTGGEVEVGGRLRRIVIPPQIGGNLDTKV